MNELGLNEIPVIAIAKGKFRNSGNETFFIMVKNLNLKKTTQLYFFFCKE